MLSNSGSFKRFDTIDKDDYRQSGQQPTQHATTPLWNLAGEGEVDSNIPPQPLRPAPAPGTQAPASAGHIKTVTFSFQHINETTPNHETKSHGRGSGGDTPYKRSSMKCTNAVIPKPLDAPPPPRLSASSSALSASAIPRPVAKRQVSLQNVGNGTAVMGGHMETITTATTIQETEALSSTTTTTTTQINTNSQHNPNHPKTLKRRNSSTNPFLCESPESLPESNTALQQQQSPQCNTSTGMQNNAHNNSNNSNGHISNGCSNASSPTTTNVNGSCNPFYSESSSRATDADTVDTNNRAPTSLSAKSLQQQFQEFRNRSFSTTETSEDSELKSLSNGLRRLTQNSTNPFTGLTQRVQKGPHMLQKTISEDFLFRKLGVNAGAGHNAQTTHSTHSAHSTSGNGNTTWTFGRSLLRQDSLMSLGRRNSSQCSLDSTTCGSMESINLERAISCDSVNSDTSSVFVGELDQPYTQITGYLGVGLQYDK